MVYDKLKDLILSQFGIDEDQLTPDTDIVEDLGADSLDVMEMLMALEEEYGILVVDDDVSELRTMREIAEFVENKINSK
ncbi:MAG: acyl carrier protein [Oscillospiraceae bacterium]|jgi:acyl carrier protein|nr:acyl carrier protein [Oscillospiraceae bacterium]MCR5647999.1 acyl carrier protein [Oscillospiraceae bacterium]